MVTSQTISNQYFFNFSPMQESKFRCKALFPMKIKLPITLRLAVKEFITYSAFLFTLHNFYSKLTYLSKDKDCTFIINFDHERNN